MTEILTLTPAPPRAETRRQMRQAGYKRASGKRGRRGPIRASAQTVSRNRVPEPTVERRASGLLVAHGGIIVPRNDQGEGRSNR